MITNGNKHQQSEQSTLILMELIEHKNKSPLHMAWRTYFPPINLLLYKPLYKDMLPLSLRHQYVITIRLTPGNSCTMVSIAKLFVACIPIGILVPTIKMSAWIYRKEWVIELLLFNANSAILQLYHGENKLTLNEMEMRYALFSTNMLGFYTAGSLKQQFGDKYVAPLGHIIMIPSQPVFALFS